MGYQGIEKVEHIIFISKYKHKRSSMDRYSLKSYHIISHFISILITFDHRIFEKVVNGCFSLNNANYALIFIATFHYHLKDRLAAAALAF